MYVNDVLIKALNAVAPVEGVSPGVTSNWKPESVRIDFAASATAEQKEAARQLLMSFDVNIPEPNIPKFFNDLALAILAGQIPAEVRLKAQIIQDLQSPEQQAYALNAMSSDPGYTVEQKETMNQLIAANGLALPEIQLAAMRAAQG